MLARLGDKETRLINRLKKNAGENGGVSTAYASTQTNPTFSREDLGSAFSKAKKTQKIIVLKKGRILFIFGVDYAVHHNTG